MKQPKDFIMEGKEDMGCRLKKSIYGLKQDSRQWYLKFNATIKDLDLKKMWGTTAFMQSLKMVNIFS
jgi:hypothetical protein